MAVIGCGRMGRYHARAYAKLAGATLVGVRDEDAGRAAEVAGEVGCPVLESLEEVMARASAVTVATPTKFHAEIAELLLRRGVACLIEKPMTRTVAEARRLVELAGDTGTPLQVGHIERFNPAFRSLQRLGLRPAFIDVDRISPLTFRSLDVGVVLDVMIHDIDIVLKLAGSPQNPLTAVEAVGVSATGGGVEDLCNARLTFANGCVANLTASRLSFTTVRKLRAYGPDGYAAIDYQNKTGVVFRRSGNVEAIRAAVEQVRAGQIADASKLDFRALVQQEDLVIENEDPLRAQLASFLNAVRTGTTPEVTAEDGLAAVATAQRILDAVAAHTIQ